MRRYTITVNDTTRVIDVEELTADTYRVQLDGRFVDVRLDDHRGLARTAIAPTVQVARAAVASAPAAPVVASPPAPSAPAGVTPAARAASAPAASGGGRTDRVTAPMPGVVLEVRVAPGATVTRGLALLVLEAMKMKNELKAPRDGVVAEIFVAAGAQVRYGEALLRFEASR